MGLYVTRASLEINGASITDFKAFTEKTRTIRKAVPLMYKTGAAELTQRFSGDLDYVVPRSAAVEFDAITAGTLTIEFDSGERVDFGGVHVTEVGDAAIDGENELVRKISFVAETREGKTGATV